MRKRIKRLIAPAVLATALAVMPVSVVALTEPLTVEAATAAITYDLVISEDTVLDSLVITEDQDGNCGSVVIESNATLTVNGDVTVSDGGYLELMESGKLIVKGNYNQSGGMLSYGDVSQIDITGDFVFANHDGENYNKSTGHIYWSSESAVINVGGDYICNTTDEGNPNGNLNLTGNYLAISNNSWNGTVNFRGTKSQTITMPKGQSIGTITSDTEKTLYVTDYLGGNVVNNITFEPLNDVHTIYIAGNMSIQSNKVTFNGDVEATSNFDIKEGSKVYVNGSYAQISGSLNYEALAEFNIAGDLLFAKKVGDNYEKVTGEVYWGSESAVFNVDGNYICHSTSEWHPSGILNLAGNYLAISNNSWNGTVNFRGTKSQTITMPKGQSIGTITSDTEKTLYVTDYLGGNVVNNITFEPLNDVHTIYIAGNMSIQSNKVTFNGDVEATSNFDIKEGSKVYVNGSYAQISGSLNYEALAEFNIAGDLLFAKKVGDNYEKVTGEVYWGSESAVFNVDGNYICHSTSEWHPSGILNLAGDYIAISNHGWYGTVNLCGTAAQTVNAAAAIENLKLSNPTKTYTLTGNKVYENIYTENAYYRINGVDEWYESNGDGSPSIKGHAAVTDEAVEATCASKGKTEGSHCENCGIILQPQTEIPAKPHTKVTDEAVAATCTKKGKTEGSHCETCGATIKAQKEIPAKGHSSVTDKAVAATCTKKGKTEGSHCETCGVTIKVQKEVPAKGHSWNSGKVTRKATTTRAGVKTYTCRRAGCNKTKTSSISKFKFTVSGNKTIKALSLKNKAASFTIKASTTSKGKITYSLTSYPKGAKGKITVSSTGKVTLKKGTPKGSYTIKVTAGATSTCDKAVKKVVIKVK